MALVYGKLTDVTPITAIGSVPQILYAAQSGTKTYVAELELHNWNTVTRNVIFYVVPNSGGSTAAGAQVNQLMRADLQAYDTLYVEPKTPYVLSANGDSIQFLANGTGVNVQLRGGTE